jgi:hypothetical protein
MRRLPLLLLVALAGCGSSHSTVIDAHNAKDTSLSPADASDLLPARPPYPIGPRRRAPNGKWRVVAGTRSVRLLDARTGATLDALASPIASPTAVAWSRDSTTFAVGGNDSTVAVWNEFDHRTFDFRTPARVAALAFSPAGDLLAVGTDDRMLRFWDLETRKQVAFIPLRGDANASFIRFTDDGKRVVYEGGGLVWQLRLPR